jgi:hypothetical protein
MKTLKNLMMSLLVGFFVMIIVLTILVMGEPQLLPVQTPLVYFTGSVIILGCFLSAVALSTMMEKIN